MAVLFTKVETTQCPSIDKKVNKRQSIYRMECYWVIKNDVHGITWMKVENIIRKERIQSQKIKYYMIPFI